MVVVETGGTNLNLRTSPSLNGDVVDKLAPGTVMLVIGGPQYRDNHTWWKLSNENLTGWTVAEYLKIVNTATEELEVKNQLINMPSWKSVLSCDRSIQRYDGLEYCVAANGSDIKAHVVVIDLSNSHIKIEYIIADGVNGECKDVNIPRWGPVRGGCADPSNSSYYPVLSLLQAAEKALAINTNVAVVINSDYGAGTQNEPASREHGPEGFAVVRGDRIDGPGVNDTDNNAEKRPWLAVSHDSPVKAEIEQYAMQQDTGNKEPWIYTATGGGPWLVKDGQITLNEIRNCLQGRSYSPGSCRKTDHTAVGISQDKKWLFFIIVKETEVQDIASFLKEDLEVWNAIKFDGGGSSQLWYGGMVAESKRVIESGNRKLSQYLAIFAEPGSGIKSPESSPNTPTKISFYESLQKWLSTIMDKVTKLWNSVWGKLQQLPQKSWEMVEEWLSTQWVKLTTWFEEELNRQIDNFVTQLNKRIIENCAANFILVGIIITPVILRRNRRK